MRLRFRALSVAALSLCLGQNPAAAAETLTPKLVVVIVVDQFSAELYARYQDTFIAGLHQLGSGIAYPIAYQSHAATETCPGHSTILTGDHPARHRPRRVEEAHR